MGINQDAMLMVKARISGDIDAIEQSLLTGRASVLNQAEDLRHLALDYNLVVLATITAQFERAIADGTGRIMSAIWVDALRDALGCGRADDETASALSALVGQRLYG
jgi:predicted transposase YbfD/YdcC